MRLIRTSHLKNWADSRPAQDRLPRLVKDLICAVIKPESLRFPSDDAIWLPGYDGFLTCSENHRFIPSGLSAWEAGAEPGIKGKADTDYEKRSRVKVINEHGKEELQFFKHPDVTFIFVTPRIWRDKDVWISERKKEEVWKDVLVIDGVDLQDWLELAPAVSLQFGADIGLVPEAGLQSHDQAWEDWKLRTIPPATEELVVIGREEQEKELLDRLAGPPSIFTIRGDSPRESWGFALAAIRRVSSAETRHNLLARIIVADDEEVGGRLRHLENHIILLKQTKGQVSGHLSSRGCHVIITEGNDARSSRNIVLLARPNHRSFVEALERMGLSPEDAERASRSCGLSVTILQRQRAHANYERPRWLEERDITPLLPAVLAGRWNDKRQADQEILCLLSGESDYSKVEEQLYDFLFVDEPPLKKISEMWAITAPVDAFQLTARHLSRTLLKRFKEAFKIVFGNIDPKVDLPLDDWLYYDARGSERHSEWLRSGMAETLLLISERGTDARIVCVDSPSGYAQEVVSDIPSLKDDWRVLASIRDQFARLMEAAPAPLFDCLDTLIEAKPEEIRNLFCEGGFMGSTSMHTGLLWGLETLAWSPDFLHRVALILTKLSRIDPGGRMANRPINSLKEIFLWWHPGTNASPAQALSVLDSLIASDPNIGWRLLTKLLPDAGQSISHPTAKPRWRDFGDLHEDFLNRHTQVKYASNIVDRALEQVGHEADRWEPILRSMRVFSKAQKEKVLSILDNISKDGSLIDEKILLWRVLRDFVYNHRTFSSADWSLESDFLDKLEPILMSLAPDDSVELFKWLFDEWLPELPSGEKEVDVHKKACEEMRRKAVTTILEKEGFEGIVRLGINCKFPGLLADETVPLLREIEDVNHLIELSSKEGKIGIVFSSQLSWSAQKVFEKEWSDFIYKEARNGAWSPSVTAALISLWPDQKDTWQLVEDLGEEVKAEYWRKRPLRMIEGEPEDKILMIDNLLQAGRAPEVFDRVALKAEGVPSEALIRIFNATFDELMKAQTADEIQRLGLNSFDMKEFLGQLRSRADISQQDIARMEYQILPLLGFQYSKGLSIHNLMVSDPYFFVEILCDAYFPANRDKSQDKEPTPDEKARGIAAYRLLEGMEIVPGRTNDTEINESILTSWIDAVRKRAEEFDRLTMADLKIGNILAHAPADIDDGAWPHCVIRNVIDKYSNNDIDEGLIIERHNMRGTYTKALYEGGTQERELAKQYSAWSEICRIHWPRMTQVLANIAKSYEAQAKREDARAEQDKLRGL